MPAARRSRPSLPFEPFHPVQLTEEEIARVLAGRADDMVVRAVMQILAGEVFESIYDMAENVDHAQAVGGFWKLEELRKKLTKLVKAPA